MTWCISVYIYVKRYCAFSFASHTKSHEFESCVFPPTLKVYYENWISSQRHRIICWNMTFVRRVSSLRILENHLLFMFVKVVIVYNVRKKQILCFRKTIIFFKLLHTFLAILELNYHKVQPFFMQCQVIFTESRVGCLSRLSIREQTFFRSTCHRVFHNIQ